MKKLGMTIILVLGGLLSQIMAQEDQQDIVFGKHRILHSEILDQDRILYVNLPLGYEDSNEAYPVVFQLYSHFKENYYLPAVRTTTLMGELGFSPKMIVVGIMNREFRYRDLLPVDYWQGKSEIEQFVRFFNEELIPFVQSEYRTQDYRILSGPQAGAAFGVYTFAKYPEMFHAWILSSPFWVEGARRPLLNLVQKIDHKQDYGNKFMMMSYGRQETGPELEAIHSLEKLLDRFRSSGFRYEANIYPVDFGFSTPVGIEKGLKQLFKDYAFPQTKELNQLQDVIKHFEEQSAYYGFEIIPPELALVREGDKQMEQRNTDEAIKIFKKMNELYPDGLMGYDRLGHVYRLLGDKELAVQYYQGFLDRQPENPRVKAIIQEILND